jgi:YD repeat-containing protein
MDNMLASTTLSGTTVSHAYDALGRRVSRTAGGSTTIYDSGGQTVLPEYTSLTAASNPLRKYINASYVDEPVLLVDRTAAGSTGAGADERLYYHRNQQCLITALTDSAGNVAERYAYNAYGLPAIYTPSASSTRT